MTALTLSMRHIMIQCCYARPNVAEPGSDATHNWLLMLTLLCTCIATVAEDADTCFSNMPIGPQIRAARTAAGSRLLTRQKQPQHVQVTLLYLCTTPMRWGCCWVPASCQSQQLQQTQPGSVSVLETNQAMLCGASQLSCMCTELNA